MWETMQAAQLFFIASYTLAARTVSAVEESMRALADEPVALLPVHWNVAAHPLLSESTSRVGKLLDRMLERTSDLFLPMGYSGAYQHLLLKEEVEREIEWVRANPFGSGFETVLGVQPQVFFPNVADFLRASSIAAWRERPNVLVADAKGGEMLLRHAGRDVRFPLLRLDPGWERHSLLSTARSTSTASAAPLVRRLKRFAKHSPKPFGFVVAELTSMEAEQIAALFQALLRVQHAAGGPLFASLREQLPHLASEGSLERSTGGESPSLPFDLLSPASRIPTDPASRLIRSEAERSRTGGVHARRRSAVQAAQDRELRHRLERLAPADPLETPLTHAALPHHREPERTLIADMMGEVHLGEGELAVRFSVGRLTGISRGGREHLANHPSRSYLSIGERHVPFSVMNAFSLEGERVRGLRVSAQTADPELVHQGAIALDYLLVQDFRPLVVSVTVHYPEPQPHLFVEACAILEMPIFRLAQGDEVAVEGCYPDGEEYRVTLSARAGESVLPGCRFLISHGESTFLVAFPDDQSTSIDLLPLRMEPIDGGLLLSVSPRGFSAKTAANRLAGFEEHFTLFLDADLRSSIQLPSPDLNPANEVRPSWIRRA